MEKTLRELTEELIAKDAELKEDAELFKAIFCINPHAMCVTDIPSGKILEANHAFSEMSGYALDEIIGKTVFELNLYCEKDDREALVDAITAHGWVKNMPVDYKIKGGDVLHCLLSTKIIMRKKVKALISVIVDNTEMQRIAGLIKELHFGRRKTDMEDRMDAGEGRMDKMEHRMDVSEQKE
jgi:PAS domain S-box-containing protein